jgi:O-antigen ligase
LHPHNVYIDLFAGTGLLGLVVFLWLLLDCGCKMSREISQQQEPGRRMISISILAALVAFVITGLGDVPFYHHETRIFFFTLVALTHLRVRTR